MIKGIGKVLIKGIRKIAGTKIIRWGFISTVAIVGPGPIIATIGVQGLVISAIITQLV